MSGLDLPPIGFGQMQQRELLRPLPLLGEQGPQRIGERGPAVGGTPDGTAGGATFEGLLGDAISRVQELQDDARSKVRGLALGEDVELHDVMIAANKTETAFNLLLEVRNKLVDAWEKLSRSVM